MKNFMLIHVHACLPLCVCSAPREKENRPLEEESQGAKKKEPYVFKFEKRFNFKDFDPQNWSNWMPLLLALAAGYMLTHSSGQPRQISWQEFRINYLERGEVERLEVVNRSLVRVYLRRDSASQVRRRGEGGGRREVVVGGRR